MFNDDDNPWESSYEDNKNWKFPSDSAPIGPAMTIENLRDGALHMFDRYLCFRLKIKPGEFGSTNIDESRRFLSLEETENIIKEFSAVGEFPDGMYAIGARSVEELMQKTRELLQALMNRIMSNLTHEGVNRGLLDCAFDSDSGSFAFTPSAAGEKLIEQIAKRKKNKKKKKNDDSDD